MPFDDRMTFALFQLRLGFEPVAPQNIEDVAIKKIMESWPSALKQTMADSDDPLTGCLGGDDGTT